MRLSLMAYIPATVVLLFLFSHLKNRIATYVLAAMTFALLVTSTGALLTHPLPAGITEGAYGELQELRGAVTQPKKTLVLARHGLEWWAAWVLQTDVGQRPEHDPEVWEQYEHILYLKQIAGSSDFGPGGSGGPPFPEVEIPPNAEILFEGEYFRLARATQPPKEWYPQP